MAFGLWGYLVGQVGLAASVVTAMAFGIIVDDTIHFLSRYQRARRENLAAPEAVRAALRRVGPALWTTTTILSLGFPVFATSGFALSWALGLPRSPSCSPRSPTSCSSRPCRWPSIDTSRDSPNRANGLTVVINWNYWSSYHRSGHHRGQGDGPQ